MKSEIAQKQAMISYFDDHTGQLFLYDSVNLDHKTMQIPLSMKNMLAINLMSNFCGISTILLSKVDINWQTCSLFD